MSDEIPGGEILEAAKDAVPAQMGDGGGPAMPARRAFANAFARAFGIVLGTAGGLALVAAILLALGAAFPGTLMEILLR